MATAGKNARVYVTSSPVSMLGEPLSLVSGNTYQVTDAARRIISTDATITVRENGLPSVIVQSVDLLFGLVTFSAPPTAPVTMTASYLPRVLVAEARSAGYSLSASLQDATRFGHDERRRKTTILDASGEFSAFEFLGEQALGADVLLDRITDGEPVVVEIIDDANGTHALRARALLESVSSAPSVEGLIESGVSWQLSAGIVTAGILVGTGLEHVSLSFGDPT